ncbi:MAG: glycerophosphodiester phosphodiesterase family protein [Clostridiaceae bacterium]
MKKRKSIILVIILSVLAIGGFILTGYARSAEPVDGQRTAWLTSTLIAHRGIHDEKIPENSISAFKGAVEKGYPIELDVCLTKDNQLVVFHDKKLKRLFGIDEYLKDITYEDLSKVKFSNSNETVPLFSEVLSFVNGRVPLLIEIKNEGEVGELESMTYAQLRNYQGQYAVQSFNPYSVKWFRENAPEVLRGQLSGSFEVSDYDVEYAGTSRLPWYKKLILSNMLLDFESKPQFIAYEIKDTRQGNLKGLRKLGVPVLGWTIDSKEEYQQVKDDYDNFILNTVDIN